MGVQVALEGMEGARYFFDPDVSHALALYPSTKGFQQLQIRTDATGAIPWERDAHIVWELLEASRRLYAALQSNAPYLEFDVAAGHMEMSDGSRVNVRVSDLVKP